MLNDQFLGTRNFLPSLFIVFFSNENLFFFFRNMSQMADNQENTDHLLKIITFDTNKDSDDEYVVQGINLYVCLFA